MKQIRLEVARRYLQRYNNTSAHLECVYNKGEYSLSRRVVTVGDTTVVHVRFTPKTKVFLKREKTRIAQVSEGLPRVIGHFDPFTGAFKREIPY